MSTANRLPLVDSRKKLSYFQLAARLPGIFFAYVLVRLAFLRQIVTRIESDEVARHHPGRYIDLYRAVECRLHDMVIEMNRKRSKAANLAKKRSAVPHLQMQKLQPLRVTHVTTPNHYAKWSLVMASVRLMAAEISGCLSLQALLSAK